MTTDQQLVWFNGEILPRSEVRIDVEDRGYQFADGVYEVIRLYDGRPFALMPHLQRLQRSAEAIHIRLPIPPEELARQVHRLIEQAGVQQGMVYMQITRGCAPRNHIFPGCRPTVLFYARPLPASERPTDRGVRLITLPDERWKRCWIKSIALLANVLAKNQAVAAGAEEAIFLDEGMATECSASNLFAIVQGRLITAPAGTKVLPGITRAYLLEIAAELGVPLEERLIPEMELRSADELFITSTTREIDWCYELDGRPVGNEKMGPVTQTLKEALSARIRKDIA
jgi:D-alanine transaminase